MLLGKQRPFLVLLFVNILDSPRKIEKFIRCDEDPIRQDAQEHSPA